MCEEEIKALLYIPQLVEIIKKWGLSSRAKIQKMMNMARRYDISVDVVNENQISEDGINKRVQTPKHIIMNNCDYYVQHDWKNNQKVGGDVAVSCPY